MAEPMMTFDEAIALIATQVQPGASEVIELRAAAGRVLAEPLHARSNAPRHAVSAMDGYAVIEALTSPEAPMRVVGESCAGSGYVGTVSAGQAVRIFTGAPIPEGADCVIMQEYAQRDGDTVRFQPGYGPARHVRVAGSDFAAGDLLLASGTRLTPRAMIGAAAADVATVQVARQPRIAVIGTGDELAPPGSAYLSADAIPESVSFGIAAMAELAGAEVVEHVTGRDDLGALERLAASALDVADVVIVTGGASVGDRDFAKPMFAPHGLELLFSKLAIKPGKPVWLGRARDRWVLGLPGNPTSAMVTATLFLRPLLARLQGQSVDDVLRWRRLPLAQGIGETGSRETFTRAIWGEARLTPVTNQESGAQAALVQADWLIRCPAGQGAMESGQIVSALQF